MDSNEDILISEKFKEQKDSIKNLKINEKFYSLKDILKLITDYKKEKLNVK